MFITTAPTALPGTCMLCPRSVRERYIDTEMQIEWYGAVILCDHCVMEMGRLLGMASPSQMESILEDQTSLRDENFELKKRLAALEGIRDGLAAAGFVVPDNSSGVVVPSRDDQGPPRSSRIGAFSLASGNVKSASNVGPQGGAAPEPSDDESLAGLRPDAVSDGGSVIDL